MVESKGPKIIRGRAVTGIAKIPPVSKLGVGTLTVNCLLMTSPDTALSTFHALILENQTMKSVARAIVFTALRVQGNVLQELKGIP
ncbi:hypothetical protein DY000_02043474 [Brassica cretica]|uniref:Uncharacterized protein n=1 Tax=Brassica cretica TaxID=69181 RepID=A0ABQ7BPH3_BRACR|nr:hypothetical protein DY000_02043474 [Brassica cretica]